MILPKCHWTCNAKRIALLDKSLYVCATCDNSTNLAQMLYSESDRNGDSFFFFVRQIQIINILCTKIQIELLMGMSKLFYSDDDDENGLLFCDN